MTYEINLTPENHGYTIRLIKRSYTDKPQKEIAETISTLAIIDNRKTAHEVLNSLNSLLTVCEEKKIIPKNLFRHMY